MRIDECNQLPPFSSSSLSSSACLLIFSSPRHSHNLHPWIQQSARASPAPVARQARQSSHLPAQPPSSPFPPSLLCLLPAHPSIITRSHPHPPYTTTQTSRRPSSLASLRGDPDRNTDERSSLTASTETHCWPDRTGAYLVVYLYMRVSGQLRRSSSAASSLLRKRERMTASAMADCCLGGP